MYESRYQVPLSITHFLQRLLGHFLLACSLLGGSLAIGMTVSYIKFEQLSWMDAFLNSAMLLGGMGPGQSTKTEAGKLFAVYMRFMPDWLLLWSLWV